MNKVKELFTKYENEFLNYRADPELVGKVHDFIVFENLVQFVERGDLVRSKGYEEIYFNVNDETVIENLPEETMLKLIRCGLRYSEDAECFVMYI